MLHFFFLLLKYTHTYSPAATPSPFTNTMWPTYAYTAGASCPASTTTIPVTCVTNAGSALTSSAPGLPTVASCYTGATLTATTLTSQVQTACASTSYFCQVKIKNTKKRKEIFFL